MSAMFIVTVEFGSASREVHKLQSDTPAIVPSGNSCLSKAEVESSAIRRVMKGMVDEKSTKQPAMEGQLSAVRDLDRLLLLDGTGGSISN